MSPLRSSKMKLVLSASTTEFQLLISSSTCVCIYFPDSALSSSLSSSSIAVIYHVHSHVLTECALARSIESGGKPSITKLQCCTWGSWWVFTYGLPSFAVTSCFFWMPWFVVANTRIVSKSVASSCNRVAISLRKRLNTYPSTLCESETSERQTLVVPLLDCFLHQIGPMFQFFFSVV